MIAYRMRMASLVEVDDPTAIPDDGLATPEPIDSPRHGPSDPFLQA